MTAVSAHAPHHETQATTSTPSARPPSVRDDVVVQEIRRIIERTLRNLLAQRARLLHRHQFGGGDARSQGGSPRNIVDRFWSFMDSKELNAALVTEDPDEQPARLLQLMLEGPYKKHFMTA